jgi:hypothetical protein
MRKRRFHARLRSLDALIADNPKADLESLAVDVDEIGYPEGRRQ